MTLTRTLRDSAHRLCMGTLVPLLVCTACGGGGGGSGGESGGAALAQTEVMPVQTTVAKSGPVKWYPGHYVTIDRDLTDDDARALLAQVPGFRGLNRFYRWRELEPGRDFYEFGRVALHLEQAARLRVPMTMQVEVQSYLPDRLTAPDYLWGTEFGGGQFFSTNGSLVPVLWNASVADRIARLYRALGATFDRHPWLAGVTTTETAPQFGQTPPADPVEPYSEEALAASFRLMIWGLGTGFPNTTTFQSVNFPGSIVPPLLTELRERGVGLGGPDVLIDDPGLWRDIYPRYRELAGILPLATAVQWDNYSSRIFGGPVSEPAIRELYEFGRDVLQDNYMFWEIRREPRDYFAQLGAASREFPPGPSGGLPVACPGAFASCLSSLP